MPGESAPARRMDVAGHRCVGIPKDTDVVLLGAVRWVYVDGVKGHIQIMLDVPLCLRGETADKCGAYAPVASEVAGVLRGLSPGERIGLSGALSTVDGDETLAVLVIHSVAVVPHDLDKPNGTYGVRHQPDGQPSLERLLSLDESMLHCGRRFWLTAPVTAVH